MSESSTFDSHNYKLVAFQPEMATKLILMPEPSAISAMNLWTRISDGASSLLTSPQNQHQSIAYSSPTRVVDDASSSLTPSQTRHQIILSCSSPTQALYDDSLSLTQAQTRQNSVLSCSPQRYPKNIPYRMSHHSEDKNAPQQQVRLRLPTNFMSPDPEVVPARPAPTAPAPAAMVQSLLPGVEDVEQEQNLEERDDPLQHYFADLQDQQAFNEEADRIFGFGQNAPATVKTCTVGDTRDLEGYNFTNGLAPDNPRAAGGAQDLNADNFSSNPADFGSVLPQGTLQQNFNAFPHGNQFVSLTWLHVFGNDHVPFNGHYTNPAIPPQNLLQVQKNHSLPQQSLAPDSWPSHNNFSHSEFAPGNSQMSGASFSIGGYLPTQTAEATFQQEPTSADCLLQNAFRPNTVPGNIRNGKSLCPDEHHAKQHPEPCEDSGDWRSEGERSSISPFRPRQHQENTEHWIREDEEDRGFLPASNPQPHSQQLGDFESNEDLLAKVAAASTATQNNSGQSNVLRMCRKIIRKQENLDLQVSSDRQVEMVSEMKAALRNLDDIADPSQPAAKEMLRRTLQGFEIWEDKDLDRIVWDMLRDMATVQLGHPVVMSHTKAGTKKRAAYKTIEERFEDACNIVRKNKMRCRKVTQESDRVLFAIAPKINRQNRLIKTNDQDYSDDETSKPTKDKQPKPRSAVDPLNDVRNVARSGDGKNRSPHSGPIDDATDQVVETGSRIDEGIDYDDFDGFTRKHKRAWHRPHIVQEPRKRLSYSGSDSKRARPTATHHSHQAQPRDQLQMRTSHAGAAPRNQQSTRNRPLASAVEAQEMARNPGAANAKRDASPLEPNDGGEGQDQGRPPKRQRAAEPETDELRPSSVDGPVLTRFERRTMDIIDLNRSVARRSSLLSSSVRDLPFGPFARVHEEE